MEECELCGRVAKDIYLVSIEGAQLRVCKSCSGGKGEIYIEPGQKRAKSHGFASRRSPIDEGSELVEGYGKIIHDARDRMQIPLKVLAEMINEKEAHLLRIEEEKTEPSIELTKKIEKALSIKITQERKDSNDSHGGKKPENLTLGDFVKHE